jgi:diacylglycerol kinase (ATP)
MSTRRRVLAIVNPAAGAAESPGADAVVEACREVAGEVQCVRTARPEDATEAVAAALSDPRPPHVVLAAGGDGTVRSVTEALARGLGRWPRGRDGSSSDGEGPVLLVAPAGSGNSAYRALWGELAWDEALATAFDGDRALVRELDLIRLVEHDCASFLGVNVGLIAAIVARLEATKGEVHSADGEGSDRYWSALADTVQGFSATPIHVTVDGETVHEGPATLATVGGVRRFGRGYFELLPRSELDDSLLDVCTVDGVTAERLGELARLVPTGNHLAEAEVTYARGSRVAIESLGGPSLLIEHDGDPAATGRELNLEVVAGAVRALAAPPA